MARSIVERAYGYFGGRVIDILADSVLLFLALGAAGWTISLGLGQLLAGFLKIGDKIDAVVRSVISRQRS
jgi:hypothetical protein